MGEDGVGRGGRFGALFEGEGGERCHPFVHLAHWSSLDGGRRTGKPDGTCPECSYSTTILARTFCVPPPRPTYSCVNDALLSRTFNMKCKVQQSNG